MLFIDNTKLSDAKACLRYYYFRHVRGWVSDSFDAAKIFGGAWHAAMDVLWQDHTPDGAYERFLEYWKANGGSFPIMPIQERNMAPRTPAIAELMLKAYWRKYEWLIKSSEVIEAEFLLKFPLSGGITYVGLIDKVLRERDGICLLEHKTTAWGTQNGFNRAWLRAFDMSAQVSGYLYGATQHAWPGQPVRLLIDAALVHKTQRDFTMLAQKRSMEELEEWFLTANLKAREIAGQETDQGIFLRAFPKETDSCIRFMKLCPYFDICKKVPNPELIDMPAKMRGEFWQPEKGRE